VRYFLKFIDDLQYFDYEPFVTSIISEYILVQIADIIQNLSIAQPSSRIEETAIFRHLTARKEMAWIPSSMDLANNYIILFNISLNFACLSFAPNTNFFTELGSKGTFNDSPSPSHVIARA